MSGSASTAQHASSDRGATRDRPPLRQGQLLQGHLYDENPLPPRQRALLADCPLDPGPWPLAADWPLAVQPWTLAAAPLTTAPQPSTHSLSGSSAAISGCLGSLPSLVPDHLQREVQGQRAGFSHSCHHSYHTTYHACSGSHDGPQHTRAAMSARPTLADPTAPAGPTHVPIEKQEGPNPNPSLNPNPSPNVPTNEGGRPAGIAPVTEAIGSLFRLMDVARSGEVGRQGFETAFKALGVTASPEELERLFSSIDVDEHGCFGIDALAASPLAQAVGDAVDLFSAWDGQQPQPAPRLPPTHGFFRPISPVGGSTPVQSSQVKSSQISSRQVESPVGISQEKFELEEEGHASHAAAHGCESPVDGVVGPARRLAPAEQAASTDEVSDETDEVLHPRAATSPPSTAHWTLSHGPSISATSLPELRRPMSEPALLPQMMRRPWRRHERAERPTHPHQRGSPPPSYLRPRRHALTPPTPLPSHRHPPSALAYRSHEAFANQTAHATAYPLVPTHYPQRLGVLHDGPQRYGSMRAAVSGSAVPPLSASSLGSTRHTNDELLHMLVQGASTSAAHPKISPGQMLALADALLPPTRPYLPPAPSPITSPARLGAPTVRFGRVSVRTHVHYLEAPPRVLRSSS